jgi:hypothetical protein
MNDITRKLLSAAAATVALAAVAGTSTAATTWQNCHPRRAEVNSRLHNQNVRIDRDVRDGTLSWHQAAVLHRDDRLIRQEERDMARMDGGHITRFEQRVLNQQENAVSRHIPPA